MKQVKALAALLLVLLPRPGYSFGELGLAGALPAGPAGRHRNPALATGIADPRLSVFGKNIAAKTWWMQSSREDSNKTSGISIASRLGTIRVPAGLFGFLRPTSNPFLYITDRSRFITSFDVLAVLDQMSLPWLFLLDPSQSPGDVVISVSSEEITVSGGSGEPIRFGARPGTRGISIFGTPLIPPPFIGIIWTPGPFAFETGLFWGGGHHMCSPNEPLQEVLDGGPVEDDTEYTVSAAASVQSGLSQSVILLFPLLPGFLSWRIQGAVRAVLFYAAAAARVELRTGIITGAVGSPETVFAESDIFYFYPGNGYGIGGRIDTGIVATRGRFLIGLGFLNLLGISSYNGLHQTVESVFGGEPVNEAVDFAGSLPEAVLHAAWIIETGPRSTVILMGDVGYPRTLAGHCAVAFRWGKLLLESGFGWEGAVRYDVGVGLSTGRFFVEVGMSAHQAPFSDEIVHGLGLIFGRYPGRGKR